ncbi:uncharacterized protein SCHCODRAFT_02606000 [Schizophyllum commune H4-8]|uniref:uncharacterized protein n=1 Tax=Schizophyllum commune (strain H4-8 / FGSC 9210) TaxID=578458 RepID=UPI0021603789|nr:uncharacterized protein SCHCODRAFT_02606000 [Schizophyllum commune H4-8]KAI5899748.1 hypothetical protein SCHCODRAFT_02606000 [Schizophyllum commune H4-8]
MPLVSPLPSASHAILTSVCSTSRVRAADALCWPRSSSCSVQLRPIVLYQSPSMRHNTRCFLHSPVDAMSSTSLMILRLVVRAGRALGDLKRLIANT